MAPDDEKEPQQDDETSCDEYLARELACLEAMMAPAPGGSWPAPPVELSRTRL